MYQQIFPITENHFSHETSIRHVVGWRHSWLNARPNFWQLSSPSFSSGGKIFWHAFFEAQSGGNFKCSRLKCETKYILMLQWAFEQAWKLSGVEASIGHFWEQWRLAQNFLMQLAVGGNWEKWAEPINMYLHVNIPGNLGNEGWPLWCLWQLTDWTLRTWQLFLLQLKLSQTLVQKNSASNDLSKRKLNDVSKKTISRIAIKLISIRRDF